MMSFQKDSSVFFTGEWGGGNTSPILIWKENVLDIQIFTSSSKEVWKALRKIIKKKKKEEEVNHTSQRNIQMGSNATVVHITVPFGKKKK